MPFFSRNPWDIDVNDPLGSFPFGNRRTVSGQPVPFQAQGRAGAGFKTNAAFESIMDILDRVNQEKGVPGQWRSDPNAERSLSGGLDFSKEFGNIALPAGIGVAGSIERLNRPPTTAEIMARLEELQDPGRYMMGSEDLQSQAMAAASAQYDPLIAALQGQMESTTNRANRNKVTLGQMFNSLSGNLQQDIPAIQKQYAGDKAATAQNYAGLQQGIKDQYASTQAEQEAMMQRLNIEAAAAETLPQQQRDRDYFTNLAAKEGQTQQSALGQEERGAVEYTRQGSQIARAEGTQRQADLMTQLQEMLGEFEGQIGAHQAAKQNAYTSGLGQLQSQMLDDAYSRADRSAQNYLEMINLGRMLRKDEMEMGAAGNTVTAVKSPSDVANRAMGMGLDEASAQTLQDIFMSSVGNDQAILAGMNPLTGQAYSREALAARVMEAGRADGLNSSELNALLTIALEYFGRR